MTSDPIVCIDHDLTEHGTPPQTVSGEIVLVVRSQQHVRHTV